MEFIPSLSLKVNVIGWLEFELAYYNVAIYYISQYSPTNNIWAWIVSYKKVSKKFCNILVVYASLQCIHHKNKIIQPMKSTSSGGWLVRFYGISNHVGYLMPNPVIYIWLVNKCLEVKFQTNQNSFVYTQLNGFKYC